MAALAIHYFNRVVRVNFPDIFRIFIFETQQPLTLLDCPERILLDGPLVGWPHVFGLTGEGICDGDADRLG